MMLARRMAGRVGRRFRCGCFWLDRTTQDSAVAIYDLVAYPKAEAGALHAFGGEEGLEDLLLKVCGDA